VNLPWVESPFFADELPSRAMGAETRALAERYRRDGYVVIPNVISPEDARRLHEEVSPLFQPRAANALRSENRVQDAWVECPRVRRLAGDARIAGVLELLYGRRPIPFQTLNFRFGTEQRAHSDAIHFHSIPERFMCGVWVALEDIALDSGPLFYHPGSHRLAVQDFFTLGIDDSLPHAEKYRRYETLMERLMAAEGLPARQFTTRAGSALIWSANLVHGGSPIGDPRSTRASQVTHYYFEDCIYVTPLASNPATGEWFVRRELIDIATGAPVVSRCQGRPIELIPTADPRRHRLRLPPR
jgi:hypothetical protein